jgi:opacity protein-like surface antigen
MRTKYILSVFMLATSLASLAQDMTVKSFKLKEDDTEARVNPVLDLNEQACALVKVTVKPKTTEEVKFSGNYIGATPFDEATQSYFVYLPEGNTELTVIVPSAGRALVNFAKYGVKRVQSKATYELEINTAEPRRTLIMVEGALGRSQSALGFMVGMVQKHGGYLRGRFDFRSASTSLECDDTGMLTTGDYTNAPFYVPDTKKKSRFSITAGYMYRIAKPLYAYVGAGYGSRTLAWLTVDGEWVKNKDHSASGIAAEFGGILRFGKVGVSLGYQTISFKYHEASLGVGLFF